MDLSADIVDWSSIYMQKVTKGSHHYAYLQTKKEKWFGFILVAQCLSKMLRKYAPAITEIPIFSFFSLNAQYHHLVFLASHKIQDSALYTEFIYRQGSTHLVSKMLDLWSSRFRVRQAPGHHGGRKLLWDVQWFWEGMSSEVWEE